MSRGHQRRYRMSALTRASVLLAAGGASVAVPLLTAGSAQAAPAPVEAPAAAAQHKAAQHDDAQDGGLYTVRSGDTLFHIAHAHDVQGGWKGLYQANKDVIGADANLIVPGERIALNGEKAAEQPAAPAPAPKDDARDSAVESAPQSEAPARGEEAASRSAERTEVPAAGQSSGQYADNLDGWIREALDIMKANGIPGSYEGIHRNIMRESGGDPDIANNWDINAQNGTPSIGLLQVIQPTFDAYHVEGTANDLRDPVANIVAACNYAADRYGSMDNVNGAY